MEAKKYSKRNFPHATEMHKSLERKEPLSTELKDKREPPRGQNFPTPRKKLKNGKASEKINRSTTKK